MNASFDCSARNVLAVDGETLRDSGDCGAAHKTNHAPADTAVDLVASQTRGSGLAMHGKSASASEAAVREEFRQAACSVPLRSSCAAAPADTLEIHEMSRHFGVTHRTLHYYEQLELLAPVRRGRHRHYTRRDRVRLTLILSLRSFSFPLEAIRQWLAIYDREGEERQLAAWRVMAGEQITRLERQHAELDAAIGKLRALRNAPCLHPLCESAGPSSEGAGVDEDPPLKSSMGAATETPAS